MRNCKNKFLVFPSPSIVKKIAHSNRRTASGQATKNATTENAYKGIIRLECIQQSADYAPNGGRMLIEVAARAIATEEVLNKRG